MTFSNKESLLKKWGLGTKQIAWIIIFIVLGLVMFYSFFRENRKEEEYLKHLNKEHKHS